MNRRFFLLQALLFFVFLLQVQARQLSPSATVSILTCNPGDEVYSMYGHTAIRVNDPEQRIDVVFNYGVFSFDSPDFVYRFARGQTDYMMIGERFNSFMAEYTEEQRGVYEQFLNLSPEGKDELFEALLTNALPENRVYRYNFFMDNCATRVRDMIVQHAGATIHFPESHPNETYRQLIKQFHHSFRWIDLGIDLLVGKKADVPVSSYGQMFLPEFLGYEFGSAEATIDGKTERLVSQTRILLDYANAKQKSDFPWPTAVFALLFLVVVALSVVALVRKRKADWLDYWIFGLSGLAGFTIGWFTLFSEHPAMSPNFNLLWAFPPNLLFAIIWKVKKWRPFTRHYLWVAGVVLLFSPFTGQQFNPAVYFMMLTILVRVVANLVPGKR
jgi:hypothetical protein